MSKLSKENLNQDNSRNHSQNLINYSLGITNTYLQEVEASNKFQRNQKESKEIIHVTKLTEQQGKQNNASQYYPTHGLLKAQ